MIHPTIFLKHRNQTVFCGVWLLLVLGLIVMPGFETRGLALGLIAGYLPLMVFHRFGFVPEHIHPLAVYVWMFLSSGAMVWLGGYLMDKSGKFKVYLWLLAIAVLAGMLFFALHGYQYNEWKHSGLVQQRMELDPSFVASYWDYCRHVAIPRLLAGCLWGVYTASFGGGITALIIFFKRKLGRSN